MAGIFILFWEQHRNAWRALAAILAALGLYYFLLSSVNLFVFWTFANNFVLARSVAYLPVLGAVAVIFMSEARGKISFAYPRRMLTLPVRTGTLVLVPLIYRTAAVVLTAFVSGIICEHLLQNHFYHLPQLVLAGVIVVMLQALVMLVTGFGASTGIAIFAGLAVVTLYFIAPTYQAMETILSLPDVLDPEDTWPEVTMGDWLPGVIAYVGWAVVAWRATVRSRSEIPEDPVGRYTSLLSSVVHFERDLPAFPHAAAAQRWYEWRRGAFLFPWAALGLGLGLLVVFQLAADALESRFLISMNLLVVAPAVIAILTGYSVTRFKR